MKVILLFIGVLLSSCSTLEYALVINEEPIVVTNTKIGVIKEVPVIEKEKEVEYTYWPFALYFIMIFGIYITGMIEQRRNI